MISFAVGAIVGVASVGAQTWRIMQVYEGRVLGVLLSSTLLSVSYYVSTLLIVKQDIGGYVGFSVGAAGVSMAMAAQRRSGLPEEDGAAGASRNIGAAAGLRR